jgi:molybdopterin converting factor small subunit
MCHTYLEHVQIVDSLPLTSGCDDELKRLREENALQDQIIKDLEHMITVNSAGEAQVINGLREEVKNKDRIIEKNAEAVSELRQMMLTQRDETLATAQKEMSKWQAQQAQQGLQEVISGLREEVKNKDRIIEKNSQVVRELRQRIMQLDEIFAKALQEMPKRQEQQQIRGKVLKISNAVLLILNYWILARTSCLFDSELVVK